MRTYDRTCLNCDAAFTTRSFSPRVAYCSIPCRFWPRVDVRGDDECWEWVGSRSQGYGQIGIGGGIGRAHRVAWLLVNELEPATFRALVLHRCHNRACCNHAHLYAGTHADNNRDMMVAGRFRNGWRPMFTDRTALEIRARYAAGGTSYRRLAAEYGRDFRVIGRLITGKTYRHLPMLGMPGF